MHCLLFKIIPNKVFRKAKEMNLVEVYNNIICCLHKLFYYSRVERKFNT